ncbi:MAG: hypothetical protein ABI604_06185, partial [Nitrospirota bacterium]
EEAFNSISERERDALQQELIRLSEDERLEYAIRWAQERSFLSFEEANASIGVLKLGYALAKEAALFMNVSRAQPVDAPISVWWTTNTLQRHGKEPVDWSAYTTGPVTVDTVAGDHMEAVQSIQVHQRISEILSGLCR